MIRLLIIITAFFALQPAYAAKNDKPTSIPPGLYKKLKKTEELIAKKSYSKAEQNLNSMLASVKKKSYGHATVLRSLSSVYALKGQYKKAANALSRSIALNVLPKEQEQQAILNLGQLYMATENYAKAIRTLEPWLAAHPNTEVQINVLVANAYAQLKRYRKALPYIKKAIAKTKKPKESWYQLNLALYFELKDYASAARVLKKLIRLYPDKKTYWQQLSSVYQQLKQYKKAVSVKHLAYKKGLIESEKEILDLANLFLYIRSPYRAANLIKQGFDQNKIRRTSKNWETLAHAWSMAKEKNKAINALEQASKLNDKGALYLQLGQIYIEQEKWNQAIKSLKKAISKGGLKDTGSTYLLLGMSYFEQKNNKLAKNAFLKASKYGKHKKTALRWLDYIG